MDVENKDEVDGENGDSGLSILFTRCFAELIHIGHAAATLHFSYVAFPFFHSDNLHLTVTVFQSSNLIPRSFSMITLAAFSPMTTAMLGAYV